MAKRKVVREEIVFDDLNDALKSKTDAEGKFENIEKCKIFAIIGTICGVLAVFFCASDIAPLLFSVSIILSLICYIKSKCFGKALKWSTGLAKWGWYLCPIFPADIAIAFMCLYFGICALFLFPLLALRGIKKKVLLDIAEAEDYIKEHEKTTIEPENITNC